MSINRSNTSTSLAATHTRLSEVVIKIPAAETTAPAHIKFNEESVYVTADGAVRLPVASAIGASFFGDEANEMTLYDTATMPEKSVEELSGMTVQQIMAMDNAGAPVTAAEPIGTFTYKQFSDIVFSLYINAIEVQRATEAAAAQAQEPPKTEGDV
jgi:hypothetical protein